MDYHFLGYAPDGVPRPRSPFVVMNSAAPNAVRVPTGRESGYTGSGDPNIVEAYTFSQSQGSVRRTLSSKRPLTLDSDRK